MKIIYLHGFNSDENTLTARALRTAFAGVITISYDYVDAHKAAEQISSLIDEVLKKDTDLLLAGSSLGGFWANYFAQRYRLRCAIINPALHPSVSLRIAVHFSPLRNFNSGMLREFTHLHADSYKRYEVDITDDIQRIVVLGTKDEVLDYREAQRVYEGKGKIILLNEGHRISDNSRIVSIIEDNLLINREKVPGKLN